MRTLLLALCVGTAVWAQAVTVQRGSASRNTAPGSTVHVWAESISATEVFAGWEGDVQYLLDPAAWHTTLVMPEAPVNLRATYKTVPAWTPRTANFAEIPVTYYVPPNPIGLIFIFHGTGTTGAFHFSSAEFLTFLREAVAAGFGVAGFDSENRTTAQWNFAITGSTNPDTIRVNKVIDAMRAQGVISAQLPLFASGQSNGGSFAALSAGVIRWAAVSVSCVQAGGSALYSGSMIWHMAANDDHPGVGAEGNATALSNYEAFANRRLPVRFVTWQASPLYPERFQRIPGISAADSRQIQGIFRTRGWLDNDDMLKQNPATIPWEAAIPARLAGFNPLIQRQLEATYTAHEYSSETNHLTIDVFLRAIGKRSPLEPVNAASYVGPNLTPDAIGTIFPSGLASGLKLATTGPEAGLGGATAVLRAANGTETPVPWFYVSQGQGSFVVPSSVAAGAATLKLTSGARRWAMPFTVAKIAPGIFCANGDGRGVPAAAILRVAPDNTRSADAPFVLDASAGRYIAAPLRFGSDRLFLDLYATGVRLAESGKVQVLIGGQTVAPLYAGAQPQFIGLDQVTLELPRSLEGRGKVDVVIVADGVRSNVVELNFVN